MNGWRMSAGGLFVPEGNEPESDSIHVRFTESRRRFDYRAKVREDGTLDETFTVYPERKRRRRKK